MVPSLNKVDIFQHEYASRSFILKWGLIVGEERGRKEGWLKFLLECHVTLISAPSSVHYWVAKYLLSNQFVLIFCVGEGPLEFYGKLMDIFLWLNRWNLIIAN